MDGKTDSDIILINPYDGFLSYKGKKCHLNKNTMQCLILLVKGRGITIDKHTIMEKCWNSYGIYVSENSVRQAITILRKSFKKLGINNDIILTISGRGYRIDNNVLIIQSEQCSKLDVQHQQKNHRVKKIISHLNTPQKKYFFLFISFALIFSVFLFFTMVYFNEKNHNSNLYREFSKSNEIYFFSKYGHNPTLDQIRHIENLETIRPDLFPKDTYIYLHDTNRDEDAFAFICDKAIVPENKGCISVVIMSGAQWHEA